jgi:hypothetical protein
MGEESMKKRIICICVYMLMFANLSAVLGVHEEAIASIEKTGSCVFASPIDPEDVKYIIVNPEGERGTPGRNVVGTTDDNIAPNPSFEEGDTLPSGWSHFNYPEFPDVVYSWDSTVAHSGAKSVGISNVESVEYDFAWHTTDLIPVDLTTAVYEFSVWYKFNKIPTKDYWTWQGFGMYDEDKNLIFQWYFRKNPTTEWTKGRLLTSYSGMQPYLSATRFVDLQLGKWELDSSIEVRFDDVFFGTGATNSPPDKPTTPSGSKRGKVGTEYNFSTSTTDPDGDQVRYNFSWGDGTYSGWLGSYLSGQEITASHNWTEKGKYQITIKARDYWGGESDWSDPFTVTMPYSYDKLPLTFVEWLFDCFPHAFPLIRHLLGY